MSTSTKKHHSNGQEKVEQGAAPRPIAIDLNPESSVKKSSSFLAKANGRIFQGGEYIL